MKKILSLLLLVLFLFLLGCGREGNSVSEETAASKCDSYTTDYTVQRCKAIEAEDISLCDPITHYGTREDCIMVIAELVQDESQLSSCDLSRNNNYRITCRALIKKDVNECFVMEEGVNEISDIAMRDCIELTARKLKDKTVCQAFVSHAQDLKRVCGDTTSCQEEWIDGSAEHKEECETVVEENS